MLSIGQLAAQSGVKIETIRYYERVGLLAVPPRSQGRHRIYETAYVQRLKFIRRGRELGFSLDDIRALFEFAGHSDLACAEAKAIALGQLAAVRGRIASLKKLERALKHMTDACAPGEKMACPIFEALSASESKRILGPQTL
jgi:MerR family mercuric resistance operon transcriptional regulator